MQGLCGEKPLLMERCRETLKALKRPLLRSLLFLLTFSGSQTADINISSAFADTGACKGKHARVVNATWYDLHGNRTANGDIMDRNAYTAAVPIADRHLMGTYARVRYNGISKIVLINDTGLMGHPPYQNLYLDVSRRVAQEQGWLVTGKVSVCFKLLPNYSR